MCGTKSWPTMSAFGRRVVDDLCDLGRGQSPVDRDVDGVELGQRERRLEVLGPVLVEERDAVAFADTRRAAARSPAGSSGRRARRR